MCLFVHICVCAPVCVRVCVSVFVCLCVRVCMCVYVFACLVHEKFFYIMKLYLISNNLLDPSSRSNSWKWWIQ